MKIASRRTALLGSLCDVSVTSGPRYGLPLLESVPEYMFDYSRYTSSLTFKDMGHLLRKGTGSRSSVRALSQASSKEFHEEQKVTDDIFIKDTSSVIMSNTCRESSAMPFCKQPVTSSFHDSILPSKVEKMVHNKKISVLLQKYTQVFVCLADNVASNQLQSIRRHLRPDSVILMGKNTVMKRSMEIYGKKSENTSYENMTPLLAGNVALIFTKGNLREVCEKGALIAKIGTRPLSRGLIVKAIYGDGSVFDPTVLDLIEDDSVENVSAVVSLWQPFFCLSTILQ